MSVSEYRLLEEGSLFGKSAFKKFKLESTGLTIMLIHHDGPIMSTNIVVRTSTRNNWGLPHALEHLVFMGSSYYPKGLLDFAANQCFSDGTNAWTDQDHTAYTVRCAGKDGLLTFIPIFLNHILYPNLTKESYMTEVHHVNGAGKDAGVLYCEMQSYENTMDCIAEREFVSEMFGKGSPYAVETGGLLGDVRNSCSIEKCRKFHESAYTLDNMCITICGNVCIDEVVATVNAIPGLNETTYVKRPFDDSPSEMCYETFLTDQTNYSFPYKSKTVLFPSPDNDDPGCVLIGFKSYPLDQTFQILAEDLLIDYLISTPASPMTKYFVHNESPYCSKISYSRYMYPKTAVQIKFHEMNLLEHDRVKENVVKSLQNVAAVGINVDRMQFLCENRLLRSKLEIENNDMETCESVCRIDFLYEKIFPSLLEDFSCYDSLCGRVMNSTQEFWSGMLDKLINSLSVCVLAQPSSALLEHMEIREEERVAKQISDLGQIRLLEHDKALQHAEKINDTKYSLSLFDQIAKPVFPISGIDQVTYTQLRQNLFLHSNGSSEFIRIHLIIDTAHLSLNQKSAVPILLEAFFNLPLEDHITGLLMTSDEVANNFERLFVEYNASLGLHGDQICLDFILSNENFDDAIRMINHLLVNQCLDRQRVKEYSDSLKANAKADKRCGYESLQAARLQNLFPDSTSAKSTCFEQEVFLEKTSFDDLCKNLEVVLKNLITNNYCVHLIGSAEFLDRINIDNVSSYFRLDAFPNKPYFRKLQAYLPDSVQFQKIDEVIIKVAGEESSYMLSAVPVNHSYYDDIDIGMRIFHAWFGQLDGPVGREVRGKGLAYHYYSKSSAFDGILELQLQQSADIYESFAAVKKYMTEMLASADKTKYLDKKYFELARNQVLFSLMENLSSVHKSSLWDITWIHSCEKGHCLNKVIENIYQLTVEDVHKLCTEFHSKLFDENRSFRIYSVPSNT